MSRKMKISGIATLALCSAASLLLFSFPSLAAQFSINIHAANTIIDIAAGSGSVWAILGVVGGSFGWGIALMAAARVIISRVGKAAAAAF